MVQDTAALLHNRFIAEIRKYVCDETILEAFRVVPRYEFLPSFFERLYSNSNRRGWRTVSFSTNEREWLEKIYTNRPLIISIDEDGFAERSSLQPGLIAQMIQSVQVRRGCRVLEIGTGTGYNAALVGSIAGPENVVTIDENDALLDVVRARIERTIGPDVTVLCLESRNLPESLGLFDAIIVNGSCERIDPSWMRALMPGGRIVFNWMKSFTNVMIQAEKTGRNLTGRVCQYDGDLISMYGGQGTQHGPLPYVPLPLIAYFACQSPIFGDPDFRFFLQINMPSLRYDHYSKLSSGERVYVVRDIDSNRIVHFFPLKIRGDASLWKEIYALYEKFEQLQQPSRKEFLLTVNENGVMTFSYKDSMFLGAVR